MNPPSYTFVLEVNDKKYEGTCKSKVLDIVYVTLFLYVLSSSRIGKLWHIKGKSLASEHINLSNLD